MFVCIPAAFMCNHCNCDAAVSCPCMMIQFSFIAWGGTERETQTSHALPHHLAQHTGATLRAAPIFRAGKSKGRAQNQIAQAQGLCPVILP